MLQETRYISEGYTLPSRVCHTMGQHKRDEILFVIIDKLYETSDQDIKIMCIIVHYISNFNSRHASMTPSRQVRLQKNAAV